MSFTTGTGKLLGGAEWRSYRDSVYALLFYNDKKWLANSATAYFHGVLIHYSDFKKAERGEL